MLATATSWVLAYTLLDDLYQRAADLLTHTPYWVLIAIALLLFALFVWGLIKKLFVFSVFVALILLAICMTWFFAGHALA